MKLNFFNSALIFLFFVLVMNACTLKEMQHLKIIRLKGSDTMLELGRSWAVQYMEENPDVSIYVEGGGSATGFKALADGKVHIALASRLINSSEVRFLGEKHGQIGVNFLAAKDALSVYLNSHNPIQNLTMAQLKDIFSGRIRNWNQIGGPDEKITVVLRPPTSGTYYYFKSHVLENETYVNETITRSTTKAVTEFVFYNRAAIGFGGLAYGKSVKHAQIESVSATEENVRLFKYPLSRYLYLYTIDKPQGAVKDFIDWILSTQGQRIVRKAGYIPLWE